ncbi:MAG: DDE-type integrase/transposase/recombinase [Deltaproteobacteria bacterium]|jgi:transposase InsO family protein|nr:DDE-type integrase/transposase/recombinase [Deltaproteobacteria bacterium]
MARGATFEEIVEATGKTRRWIRKIASEDNWKYTYSATETGHEKLFTLSFLPEDVRLALARYRAAKSLTLPSPATMAGHAIGAQLAGNKAEQIEKERIKREAQLAEFNHLSQEKQAIAYARRDILKAADAYLSASGNANKKRGIHLFCQMYNSSQIRIADHIYTHVDKISLSTMNRWQAALKDKGVIGLAPGHYNPQKGKSGLSEEQQEFIVAMLGKYPHSTMAGMESAMEATFADIPHISSIRRFTNRWKQDNRNLLLYITNPDAWRNKCQFALGDASEQVERLNQVWQFDSTPADVMLADGRHCLIGVIDVFSRRFKLLVSKTSRATAVAALIRRAILDWGVPEIAKTDNGSDYVSHHIVQVFEGLGIEQKLCPPFTPEAKPHIERAFKTFAHSFLEFEQGYIGHSVADRKDIEARRSFADRIMGRDNVVELKMTAEELQIRCDRWCAAIYHQKRHRSLNNRTPMEVVGLWQQTIRMVSNQRALDILLAEAPGGGTRVVGKSGLSVDNITYISDELPEVGTIVRVKKDETDLGTIHLFDEDGKFICNAQDPLRTGIDRAEVASTINNRYKKLMRDGAKDLRSQAKKQAVAEINERILEHGEAKTAKIVHLPRATEEYTTPALDEAAIAVTAMDAVNAENKGFAAMETVFDEIIFEQEEIEKPKEKVVLLRSDADTYDQIKGRIKPGRLPLRKWEYDFLNEYYQTPIGSTYKKIEGDFREKFGVEDQVEEA